MKLKLLNDTDPFLNFKQEPSPEPLLGYDKIVEEMFTLMDEYNGIGLAANQVGIFANLFIMKINDKKYTIVNPKILKMSEKTEIMKEGCLSFPKLELAIARPSKIIVDYADLEGNHTQKTFKGLFARCFLHECDHLQGITFINKKVK